MKNIPIPTEKQYKLQLVNKIEMVIKRMRWKALFFDNNNNNNANNDKNVMIIQEKRNDTYGLKSGNCPPTVKELNDFESDLFDLVKIVKFKNIRCDFQNKLK